MNDQETLRKLVDEVEAMKADLKIARDYIEARKVQQLTYPVDDTSRIALGMGVQGTTTDTTPVGAVLVDTNVGQLKVLIA